MIFFSACSDEEKNNLKNDGPSVDASAAFDKKYGNRADQVQWRIQNIYQIVDFYLDKVPCTAWFDMSGKWYMTKSCIQYAELPEAVKREFSNLYRGYEVEIVDKLERENLKNIYVLQASNGNVTKTMRFSYNGFFLRENVDLNYIPLFSTGELVKRINRVFENIDILDVESEGKSGILVTSLYKEKRLIIKFEENEFYYGYSDLKIENVPDIIKIQFESKGYTEKNGYVVRQIQYIMPLKDIEMNPSQDFSYYAFTVEKVGKIEFYGVTENIVLKISKVGDKLPE